MKLAQNLNAIQGKAGINLPFKNIGEFVSTILPYIFTGAGIALLIYLILGGLQLMTARGDPKAVQMAQGKITNALIGFVIILLAYSIVSVLGQVLKIGAFSQIFQSGSQSRPGPGGP